MCTVSVFLSIWGACECVTQTSSVTQTKKKKRNPPFPTWVWLIYFLSVYPPCSFFSDCFWFLPFLVIVYLYSLYIFLNFFLCPLSHEGCYELNVERELLCRSHYSGDVPALEFLFLRLLFNCDRFCTYRMCATDATKPRDWWRVSREGKMSA